MKPFLALAVLAAVLLGGFFIGLARTVTDTSVDW